MFIKLKINYKLKFPADTARTPHQLLVNFHIRANTLCQYITTVSLKGI